MKLPGAFICMLLFAYSAYTQDSSLAVGIKLGVALSNSQLTQANPTFPQENKMKTGLLIGGFANLKAGKDLVFQPGLQYVRKGWREDYSYGSFNQSVNYLEVPLNILLKLGSIPKNFYLGTGLSPAFNLTRYMGTSLKDFDLGLNVVAGYTIPIGFSINLGYTYGLLNVSDDKTYINKFLNRYLAITAGYEF